MKLNKKFVEARKNAKFGDWQIHAIYDGKEDIRECVFDIHTHGIERYGLKNLAISVVGRPIDATIILNEIAWGMIQGENYNVNEINIIDDASVDNGYIIFHVFHLAEKKLHDDDVLFITYIDNKEIISPITGKVYKYIYNVDKDGSAKWEEVGDGFSLPPYMRRELGIE